MIFITFVLLKIYRYHMKEICMWMNILRRTVKVIKIMRDCIKLKYCIDVCME